MILNCSLFNAAWGEDAEMARRGFHYDRTAAAHALIDLVKI